MKTGTKLLLVLAAFALPLAAQAQNADVTFQVDLSAAIDSCQFVPVTQKAFLRGSFNNYDESTELTDANGDKVYAATVNVPSGTEVQYKFFLQGPLGWEDDESTGTGNNREYTPTADPQQTVAAVTFNKSFTAVECPSGTADYEIEFQVDMSVAKLSGAFNSATDIVVVAGGVNGWSTTSDTLFQDFANPDLYTGFVKVDSVSIPGTIAYKYVIGKPTDATPQGWESGSDRTIPVDGSEPDTDGDGYRDISVLRFYNDVDASGILTEETTIVFEVDLRPAFYFLADSLRLPSDTQTGDPVTTLTGVAINGPVAGSGDGLNDWSDWGPSNLGSIPTRVFKDDGVGVDRVAGDSVYTLTLTYNPGTPRILVGKMGTDGYDNEGGFGADTYFNIGAAAQGDGIIHHVFGAVRTQSGRVVDDRGPNGFARAYDPYIMIDSSATPNVVTVVRRGGSTTVGVEDIGGEVPVAFTLGLSAPNPFRGQTTFAYTLPQAQKVTVRVFDVTGRVVATLVDAFQAASTYEVTFDGEGLAAGMYFYQVQAAGTTQTGQMVLVR